MFCRQDKVPDILFATVDIPDELPVTGNGCMIQARVIRFKKKEKDESNAENVSQILPFLEFELHQQLVNKLKIKGMNAIFGMRTRLSIGEQAIIGVMTGTAMFLTALPPPPMLLVAGRRDSCDSIDDKTLLDIQRRFIEVTKKNRQFYNIKDSVEILSRGKSICKYSNPSVEDSKTDKLDLLADVKETYILEVDDQNDANILPLLFDSATYEGFNMFNTQSTPGFPLFKTQHQFLSVFNRVRIPIHTVDNSKITQWLSNTCEHLLMGVRLKTRSLMPCCLRNTSFDIEIVDDEYFQLTLSGFAMTVDERFNKPLKTSTSPSVSSQFETSKVSDDPLVSQDVGKQVLTSKPNKEKNSEQYANSPVIICPMDWIPKMQVISYLGNINVFLIRESTDVKEDGGLNLFMQQFINEVHAIIRAHVLALSGNAILSFYLNEIVLLFSPHKNQAQCLINVSGDAAEMESIAEQTGDLYCNVGNLTPFSSIDSSPVASQPPELVEEIKYKLDRAVFGTNV